MSEAQTPSALTLTPLARRGLIALLAILAFFLFDRLSLHMQQKRTDLQLVRAQHAQLVQIATGQDPTPLLVDANQLLDQAQTEILREGTTGLNSAKLQLELVNVLNGCGMENATLIVEPEEPEAEGELFLIDASLRVQTDLLTLSQCMHQIAEHPTRIHVQAFRWNSARQLVMQLQAFARNDAGTDS